MQMGETVSIVLCTYNGEKFIREQIDSLLSQTVPIYEIIIQDDCSTDGTWNILRDYQSLRPDIIKLFRNEHNLFWNQNFYSAIQKATGDYIALCDQDDIWADNKIEKQVKQLSASGFLINVCSHYYWKDKTLIPIIIKEKSLLSSFFYPQYYGHLFLLRSTIKPYLSKGVEIDMAHDIFLGIVGTHLNSIEFSQEILVKWRRHDNSSTSEPTCESISGVKKCLYTIYSLIKGKKSSTIREATLKYKAAYEYIDNVAGGGKLLREIKLMDCLSRQTLFSYIRATILFCILCNEKGVLPQQQSHVKAVYQKTTFLLKWWYIHQNNL